MSVEKLKKIKDTVMSAVEMEMMNLKEADTEELGDAIDMIKDISEAIYYCTVTEAMEEYGHEGKQQQFYPYPMGEKMYYHSNNEVHGNTDWRDSPRSYYSNGNGNSSSSSSGGNSNRGSSSSYYTEREYPYEFRDYREGRSPRSRRMYMEAKETHQDKTAQMRELEKYMQELAQDVVEMVEDATQEEKQYLSKKVAALANKLAQLNG